MSTYDSSYDPYHREPRPVASAWPLLALLLGLAVLLGGLVYWFWPMRHAAGTAQPSTACHGSPVRTARTSTTP